MRLWLLCCVLLFAVAQGYDWLSHQAWVGSFELGLPWIVLGGIGLAIASNPSLLKTSVASQKAPEPTLPTNTSNQASKVIVEDSRSVTAPAPVSAKSKRSSISFEINKRQKQLDS